MKTDNDATTPDQQQEPETAEQPTTGRDNAKLAEFARFVLRYMEESEDWSSDTIQVIAETASQMGLAVKNSVMFERTEAAK